MPRTSDPTLRFRAFVLHDGKWIVAWAEFVKSLIPNSIRAFMYDTRKWTYFDAKNWKPLVARTIQEKS